MRINIRLLFILLLAAYFLSVCFFYNFSMNDYQQFAVLSKSFLAGKLYFTQAYSTWWHDAVPFNGQYFWPLGPLPAVILMPFQLLSSTDIFHQGALQPFLVLGVFLAIFGIAKRLQFKSENALYLAVAFCFASSFLGVAFWPNSWFFSQVITTLLILLALREYVGKKRYALIGILFGLILTTRLTAFVGIAFFVFEILLQKDNRSIKFKKLFTLGLPVLPFLLALGWYNYARFGNVLEQGYSMQMAAGNFSGSLRYGLFGFKHILGNLYYLLLSTPQPVIEGDWSHVLVTPFIKADPWGMSIFITSPYLLYLFLISFKSKVFKLLFATGILVTVPIILYYGIGWYQFGYRYALDFLPYLFLLFILGYKDKNDSLSLRMKLLIVFSSFVNLYLFSHLFLI